MAVQIVEFEIVIFATGFALAMRQENRLRKLPE